MIVLLIDVVCDGCPQEPRGSYQSTASTIASAERRAAEYGWTVRNGRHTCPACTRAGQTARAE